MGWIESHTVLLRHRKVLQLSASLSIPPVLVIGHLHALWHAVLEQQEDGDLSTWPNAMIAHAAAFVGDVDLFVTELQQKNWLDGKMVHDWLEYAGRYLESKYRTSNPKKLKAIFRKHKTVRSVIYSPTKVGSESPHLPNLPDLPNPPTEPTQPCEFDEFWKCYPRKVGKDAARRSWRKLNGTRPDLSVMIDAIARQKRSDQWLKDGGRFIPHPATWLNGKRWEDEVMTAISHPKSMVDLL